MRIPRYGPRLFGEPIIRSAKLTLLIAAIAVLIAYLLRDRGGFLLLGLLAGVLAATGVAILLAPLRPVGALLDAARPLGVPVLLIVAAGTVDSPFVLQLVAGALAMMAAVHVLIRPEIPRLKLWAERMAAASNRPGRVAFLVVTALLIIGVVIGGFALPPGDDSLEARGGAASYLFTVSVILLGLAVVLRLIGYARSLVKLPVALFAILAGVRLAMEAGLLGGDGWLDDNVSWLTAPNLLLAAGVVLLLSVAGELFALVQAQHSDEPGSAGLRTAIALERPPLSRRITEAASALGLGSAVAAAVVLFAAMVLAANPGRATGALAGEVEAGRADAPPAPPSQATDQELAEAYSPVLLFSKEQDWSPISVDDYLERAGDGVRITDWEGRRRSEPISELTDCPDIVPAPCFTMATRCEDSEDPCAQVIDHPADGERVRDGAVYVRVLRKGEPRPDNSPKAFDDVGEYGKRTTILLQYWYFYAYDDWVSPVIAGQLRQWHEADWEAITIGLADEQPLFVAFSQHCAGEWYRWRDVRVADAPRPRLHPLVAVASGSQANYRYPNASQAPDWTACANLPPRTTTLVSYASNIRDRTGADWSWTPAEHILTNAREAPMNFLGRWAPFSRTELETLYRETRLGPDARGPATPSLQPLWREPMRTIFKTDRWNRGKE
jgi:hypothetical protein